MQRVKITAKADIVTKKGFTIAKGGDVGFAARDARPHDVSNLGKVLVFFGGRSHGYWCDVDQLTAVDSAIKLEEFISKPLPKPYQCDLPVADQLKYHFGKNLKLVRDSRQLSQAELGQRMRKFGVKLAQSTVCYRENSPNCPSGRFVNAASGALDIPAYILFLPLDNVEVFNEARKFISNMSSSLCEKE